MLAAGVGCRANCDVEDLEGAILAALQIGARDLVEVFALYAPEFKREERSLFAIADKLGKPLIFVPLIELEKHANLVITKSERVMRRFGLPSIAETAALAGARALSPAAVAVRLLGSRAVRGGATCALAESESAADGA